MCKPLVKINRTRLWCKYKHHVFYFLQWFKKKKSFVCLCFKRIILVKNGPISAVFYSVRWLSLGRTFPLFVNNGKKLTAVEQTVCKMRWMNSWHCYNCKCKFRLHTDTFGFSPDDICCRIATETTWSAEGGTFLLNAPWKTCCLSSQVLKFPFCKAD